MVTNVYVKFNYERLRIDKALCNFRKSDNNNNNNKYKNEKNVRRAFRVKKIECVCRPISYFQNLILNHSCNKRL